jgi:hypothetical protein
MAAPTSKLTPQRLGPAAEAERVIAARDGQEILVSSHLALDELLHSARHAHFADELLVAW